MNQLRFESTGPGLERHHRGYDQDDRLLYVNDLVILLVEEKFAAISK